MLKFLVEAEVALEVVVGEPRLKLKLLFESEPPE